VPIPPKTGEVNDCLRFGLALIQVSPLLLLLT